MVAGAGANFIAGLIPTVPVPVVFLVSHSSSDWAALDPNPRKALRPGEE